MFNTEPGPNREQLGFKDAVLGNFDFLASFGLKPKRKEVTLVRYESKGVFVEVFHGRSSFEIGVEVGRRDRTERYGLDYMVSWAGKSAWEAEGFGQSTMFQVSTAEGVQRMVAKVAELLRKYGDPFLRGDPEFYNQLAQANERASVEYTRRQMIEDARKEADEAWAQKNYARVVELYQPLRDDLTEIEAKRLAYSEKHMLQTQPAPKGVH